MRIVEYVDLDGGSPFARWFNELDSTAATKVTVALARIEIGNLSNMKAIGGGLLEYRIDFGPGYRVYFGRHGDTAVLLAGGTKRRQQREIETAHARWADYSKRRAHRER